MRTLKLVIWDLDDTIIAGSLEEGDETINPAAAGAMVQLSQRGVLQTLATQNQPQVFQAAADKFGWSNLFVQTEVDLAPKAKKLRRILDRLAVDPLDAAFVDEDPFERDSIIAQVPGISAWSIADLKAYIENDAVTVTEEGRRRPAMYLEQQARARGEGATDNYTDFLRTCNLQIKIRPYAQQDAERVRELLTRTHRMNLGVLPVEEAIARLNQPGEHHVVLAEMRDNYGDMGRCGVIHLRPDGGNEAIIESLAISCRTRGRGLSLAMLVGLLRHPRAEFQRFRCRYIFNGFNRPLRMLLMAAGFKPHIGADELILSNGQLTNMEVPDWVHFNYDLFLTSPGK
jgi:FkbH-like protein